MMTELVFSNSSTGHNENRTAARPRLDAFLCEYMPERSRSFFQKLIRDGLVKVNGKYPKASQTLNEGDIISFDVPRAEEPEIQAENIELDVVYEDEDVIIINKPKGMVVHPAPGHSSGTLVNALMYHCRDSLSGINGELRPGIVHRIDRDTTGLLIACKNDRAHNIIAEQLAEHTITRRYIALVYGNIKEDEGTVDKPLDRSRADRKVMAVCPAGQGRDAVTHYRVLERFAPGTYCRQPVTMIECRLETGRTHQIRVHMKYIGHPLLGDEVYGISSDRFSGKGQYLHAAVLGFTHPSTGERMSFEAELPDYFKDTLDKLRR